MAATCISGKDGYVTKQVSGVDTLIVGIREWNIDLTADLVDTTEFAVAGVGWKSKLAVLNASTGTFVGIVQSIDVGVDVGTTYNLMLNADTNRAYYGTAHIASKGVTLSVTGEALMTFGFEFTGKVYILGTDVVVDGDFTAATDAAWTVGANQSYDTTNDQVDWDGDGDLAPDPNTVITDTVEYWTQMKIENDAGVSSLQLKLGTAAGDAQNANGTFTEIITANSTTFTVVWS